MTAEKSEGLARLAKQRTQGSVCEVEFRGHLAKSEWMQVGGREAGRQGRRETCGEGDTEEEGREGQGGREREGGKGREGGRERKGGSGREGGRILTWRGTQLLRDASGVVGVLDPLAGPTALEAIVAGALYVNPRMHASDETWQLKQTIPGHSLSQHSFLEQVRDRRGLRWSRARASLEHEPMLGATLCVGQ